MIWAVWCRCLDFLRPLETFETLCKVYCSEGFAEPLPDVPGVSLTAGCVSEELQTGSIKMAMVTAEFPGEHRTLFVAFKGAPSILSNSIILVD